MSKEKAMLNDEMLHEVSGGTNIPIFVQKGDTLGALAKKYGCTIEQLCQWNGIKNADMIAEGQKLTIKF